MTDFRPGYRAWHPLPQAPDKAEVSQLAAQIFDCPPECFYAVERQQILATIAAHLGEDRWVLFYETAADGPVNDWFHILRDELNANVYRLTAASISDLEAYLASSPATGMVLTRQVAPDTGEFVDIETLFSVVKRERPQMTTVADISFGLGVMPYYHTHWLADISLVSRPQLGHYLMGEHLDLQPTKTARPILGQHLQYAIEHGNWAVWNRVHQAAATLRQTLHELGGKLHPQTNCHAITAFSLPEISPAELSERLADQDLRVAVSTDLDRMPCVLVQHAPNTDDAVTRLCDALRAL